MPCWGNIPILVPPGAGGSGRSAPHDPAIGGLNVTIPYKRTVLGHLDYIDSLAQRLGSVNTIVREQDGKLHGYNTDYHGFMSTLCRSRIYVGGKKALVLGTGGASAPVSAVLEDLGAQVVMISRTGENNYQNLFLHRDAAVIVNTTPVGMYPNTGTAPVDIRQFPALEGVFDRSTTHPRPSCFWTVKAPASPDITGCGCWWLRRKNPANTSQGEAFPMIWWKPSTASSAAKPGTSSSLACPGAENPPSVSLLHKIAASGL